MTVLASPSPRTKKTPLLAHPRQETMSTRLGDDPDIEFVMSASQSPTRPFTVIRRKRH